MLFDKAVYILCIDVLVNRVLAIPKRFVHETKTTGLRSNQFGWLHFLENHHLLTHR